MLNRLLNRLNRVFNKEPDGTPCIMVTANPNSVSIDVKVTGVTVSATGMTTTILCGNTGKQLKDGVPTPSTWNMDVYVASMKAVPAAANSTINDLVTLLTGTYGCTASYTSGYEGKEVNWLVEGVYTGSAFTIPYPTALLYNEFQLYARTLEEQSSRLKEATDQAYLHKAGGNWLDTWCRGYYGVARFANETDADYAARTINEVLRPTQNNKAIQAIIQDALGITCKIKDAYPLSSNSDDIGRFIVEPDIDHLTLTTEQQNIMLMKVDALIAKYKAAGTDRVIVPAKLTQVAEMLTLLEAISVAVHASFQEDAYTPACIRVGTGWRVGRPGLHVGTNDALMEQVFVQKILQADSSVSQSILIGG